MFCYAQIFESILLSTAWWVAVGGGRWLALWMCVALWEGHYDVLLANE